ncbi:MAG: protein phosphatase CheZ [Leptospirillia bacterium]
MQIMTFPLAKGIDLGIRMTEIRKIESLKDLPEDKKAMLSHPQEWFGLPVPEDPNRLKGISLSSCREAIIAVPRVGRILRIFDSAREGSPHPERSFLTHLRTIEGTDVWVLDVPTFRAAHGWGESSSATATASPQTRSDGKDSPPTLIQQVGQTARDIQRVLSLSASLVDTLRFMEGKLPETSHGLEIISQMTEDAAHKLMNTLESLLEEHEAIRKILADDQTKKSGQKEKIEEILASADERIMHGFEAMAFQDLVGQNIKLIGGHLRDLESRLVQILIETNQASPKDSTGTPGARSSAGDPSNSSGTKSAASPTETLKGVGATGDIDQSAVDQLLSEFGF